MDSSIIVGEILWHGEKIPCVVRLDDEEGVVVRLPAGTDTTNIYHILSVKCDL